MKLILDNNSELPLNEQIRLQIARQITDGTLKDGECLPSIRFVAKELGIGVITVKTAYEKLETDGFIYTAQGKGCFVRSCGGEGQNAKINILRGQLRASVEYCRSLGMSKEELLALVGDIFDGK